MQNKAITKAEALKRIEAGEIGVIVDYRFSIAETLKWRDKTSGKALSAPMLRHTVEAKNVSMSVSERVDESFDVTKFEPTINKGEKAFLLISELTTDRGSVKARGELIPIRN